MLSNYVLHHPRGFFAWPSPWNIPIHLLRVNVDKVENRITLGNVEVAMYDMGFLRLKGELRWRLATTNEDTDPEPISLQSTKLCQNE